jgi:hypothetical protein
MTKPTFPRAAAVAALALAGLLGHAAPARSQQAWGDVKGQVVFGPAKIPEMPDANVDKDKQQCLAKGAIKTNDLIIDPKTKGVKYVIVYLQDLKSSKKDDFAPPVHPKLQKFAKQVEIDEPCCTFEPRLVGLREGQELVVKNSMTIAHSFKIDCFDKGPNVNLNIPGGGKVVVKGFLAKAIPTTYTCPAHAWMRGHVAVFKHPYFAVTDKDGRFEIKNAPAGKFRLVFWHEKAGWVVLKGADRGQVVEVKSGKTTTLGPVKLTPLKE